jgi:hypothetical protein
MKTKRMSIVVVLGVCLMSLVACGPSWNEIAGGTYTFASGLGIDDSKKDEWKKVKLSLDREKNIATFTLPDGTTQDVSFTAADRADWVNACPTNFSSSRLEYLSLKDPLTINGTTYQEPILFSNCTVPGASPSPTVFLAEKAQALPSGNQIGTNCNKESKCVAFSDSTGSP